MAKGDQIGRRPLTGKKPDEIRSVEDFEREFAKVDAFIEELGKDTNDNFQIYKEGFWPKFITALEMRYNRDVRPRLNLSFEERRKDFSAPKAAEDAKLEEMFLCGGARLPFMPHVFSMRFAMRGAFQELVQAGVLNENDRTVFMGAMPRWEPRLGGMSKHKQGKLLSEVLQKEIENRSNLAALLEQRGVAKKIDDILEHYSDRLETFWGAVRGYPETFDETKDAKKLYRYGLIHREILAEIDRKAVEECIQHTFPADAEKVVKLKTVPHDLGGTIMSEIDHGFTHAADHPAALTDLNRESQKEIESVLGSR